MADLESRLAAALAGRYTMRGEIGRGGMAVVFRAEDIRHQREVAIKVLAPDLAASLGHDRFLREIRVAARLNHPNILALHDSGDADGLLYYVMPVVHGESLAARLRREGQLPIEDALRIGADAADALDYAGKEGVIHRDIKPGNILLTGDHALVADFGLAHALEQDQAVLTSSGLVVGTPMYMSPEQIGSSSRLDPRSDQYSLGCVIYEMLVGEPPFTGASVQQVFARHAVERVPSIRAVREAVPEIVEAAVQRTLAKTAADRFPSSGELARVLRGESFQAWSRTSHAAMLPAARERRRWLPAALAALVVIVALVTWRALASRSHTLPPDPSRIAILPLTAANPGDSLAAGAGQALANLLADRFIGLGGPRAADPSGVRAAMERAGVARSALGTRDVSAIARALGSGKVLRGQVLASGQSLSVTATIESAPDGAILARVSNVAGTPDQIAALADRVAAGLMASLAGQSAERLPVIQRASLPAARAFLAAEREFAGGHFTSALAHYSEALDRDSSLILAGIGWRLAGAVSSNADFDAVSAWIQPHLALLPPTDRRFASCIDRDFSFPPVPDSEPYYRICESVASSAPDRPDIWYQLGMVLNQQAWAGLPEARDRAAAAFRRALEIDSTYVPALGRLLEIEAGRGDTATVRRLGRQYVALDTDGDLADFYRWLIAASLSDSAQLAAFHARIPDLSNATLDRLISAAQVEGLRLGDAMDAVTELQRRAGVASDLIRAYQRREELALNRGAPAEAARVARAAAAAEATGSYHDFSVVFAALFWDGDTTLAAETVARLTRQIDESQVARMVPDLSQQHAICAVGLWQAGHDQWDPVPPLIARLRRATARQRDEVGDVCLLVLPAWLAVARRSPEAAQLIAQLDSPRVLDPFRNSWAVTLGNLTLAELYSQRGEYAKALAAVQRHAPVADAGTQRVQVALSTLFREEGRLAKLTGNKADARAAYGHYLALRSNPEPSLRAEVNRIRAEMTTLE
jgi:tetratricopeptide (TPR) repeat protein